MTETPLSLTIQNFRSFTKPQRFVFPQQPGLYFMRGENRAEPRLEANGAGKSTVWDALCWVKYGRTTSGLKSGDVANWLTTKGVRVAYEYADAEGEVHTLVRTWGPISLQLDGVDVGKDAGHELDYVPFLHSILMAQGQPMFLDLKAEPQAALFTEVLNLDAWLERSKRASTSASALDLRVRQAEQRVAGFAGRLQAFLPGASQEEHDAWEQKRVERIAAVRKALQEGDPQWTRQNTANKARQRECTAAWERTRQQGDVLRHAESKADATRHALTRAKAITTEAKRAHAALNAKPLPEYGSKCEHCGHTLDAAAMKEHRHRRVQELQASKNAVDDAVDAERRAVEAVAASEAYVTRTQQAYDDLHGHSTALEHELGALRQAQMELEKRLTQLDDELGELEHATNPHARALAEARAAREAAETELATASTELNALRERYALCALWVKGFKEVRLRAIQAALVELELEANSALVQLGLLDWTLMFSVEKETKAGAMSRGFDVSVASPAQQRPMPWAAWSGGEAQRLRIGTTMGLSDLIRNRMGIDYPLEVWDEPTAGLSAQGVDDLLHSLRDRAVQERRQIWVVDHRSLSFGGFAGTVLVVKDAQGSRLEAIE